MVERRQRGVALLTALLVFTLASILTVTMTHRQLVAAKRGQNLIAREQAVQVAYGLEDWALVALRRDATETGSMDARTEPWAQSLPPLPTERGFVTGQMEDLDGRFNVNNLVVAGERDGRALARFRRLLVSLSVDPLLAEAVADWQDPDNIAAPDGAEDDYYTRQSPAYRTANRSFQHPSELRLVAGVSAEVYRRLEPHVATLPVDRAPTPVNVNTAGIPVLMSLHPEITEDRARRWWAEGRAEHPSVREFLEGSQLSPPARAELRDLITVDSRYFLARGNVVIDDRPLVYYSLIEQGREGFRVIQRSRGVY